MSIPSEQIELGESLLESSQGRIDSLTRLRAKSVFLDESVEYWDQEIKLENEKLSKINQKLEGLKNEQLTTSPTTC